MTALPDLQWKRIVAGGIAPHLVSVGALVLTIIAYTLLVVFGTGGGPDQVSLQQFNSVVGTQLFPLVTVLLTAVAAAWVVRHVDPETAVVHGLAVGVLAGLVGFAFGAFDVVMVIRFVATVTAGVLGAKLHLTLLGGRDHH